MTRSRLGPFAALVALLLVLPACDSDGDGGLFAEAEANLGQWTFVEIEGAQCRDGSPTGIGVRLQADADDLMIYFEGGGACFSEGTCATNPASFGATQFSGVASARGEAGVFSTAPSNPVGDWNAIYVPYCTGDLHGGSFANGAVQGVAGTQQFVGHRNVERYLDALTDYFDTPDRVLVTGISAGGYGALINFGAVADAFAGADLTLLDDSGPVFYADNVLSPQLVAGLNVLYNLPAALPGATALFQPDGLQGIHGYYATTYPTANFGLSSYLGDDVIQEFLAAGQGGRQISNAEFAAGLRDLNARAPADWKVYLAEGDAHTFLSRDDRYAGTSAGVVYRDWLGQLLAGTAPDVDPGAPTAAPLAARR